jgi:protein-tyrosine phosphatase
MCSSAVEIIPHLWLGNIKASRNADFIKNYKVNCILNCTKNFDFYHDILPPNTQKIRIAVSDTGTEDANNALFSLLDKAVTYIQRQLISGNTVLVHCYAGKQRSPAVVAAYLIKYCDWSHETVLTIMKDRWGLNPDHYLMALIMFAKSLKNPKLKLQSTELYSHSNVVDTELLTGGH